MNEPAEHPPIGDQAKPKEYPIVRSSNYGFHYTVDDALPATFEHGILSRFEEINRGLKVRKRTSQSHPDMVFFTTDIEDLYFTQHENEDLQTALSYVVGIAIDRPDFARAKDGHFGEENVVQPDKFKALIFVDTEINHGKKSGYDLGHFLPEDTLQQRIRKLRTLCESKEIDLPIYGVSGNLYWPERMTREQVRLAGFR